MKRCRYCGGEAQFVYTAGVVSLGCTVELRNDMVAHKNYVQMRVYFIGDMKQAYQVLIKEWNKGN
jgi:hypothetical protein